MSFLEIRDLKYTYPSSRVRAVDGLSLNAEPGQIIAVIGPNAAGKSTFALLLKGLLRPDNGTISINGNERNIPGPDPGIGILFANPENQLVTTIVEEDVAFGLEVLCQPPRVIEKKVGEVLERLGISHLKKRMPHLMSGGEQQLAALAGVLILDPDILVLDEPTTYLDPVARVSALATMRHLALQGKIIFHITHDMKEAAMADRVILVDGGSVVVDGIPEVVFHRPELADRYDVFPPFLLRLVLELRSMGVDVKWPSDPAGIAVAISERLQDIPLPPGQVAVCSGQPGRGIPALSFERICFSYGHRASGGAPVLNGVDFSIDEGRMALVCGANGSGKSTLMQMSNGLIEPDSGEILLGGQHLRTWSKKRGGIPAQVALLFQNPERQVFSATVFDDIAFGPRNLGLSAEQIEKRVLKAAHWAGLPEELLKRSVFNLSGGQMRRTAVAGILAMEAQVLVLDEPTDGLDPGGAGEFYNSARKYCDETGTAIVMATHAIPEKVSLIDHIGHLSDGRMQSAGPPSTTLTGVARTLPSQFLPDHLILVQELLARGIHLSGDMLDPDGTRKQVLVLARGSTPVGGT